jgi:hypothetical protein
MLGAAQADGAGGCVGFDVADADVPVGNSQTIGDLQTFAAEGNFWLAAFFFQNFDVGPGDSAAPPGAENFHDGFLGGESAGQVLEISFGISGTIGLLASGEQRSRKCAPCSSTSRRMRTVSTISMPWPMTDMRAGYGENDRGGSRMMRIAGKDGEN